MPRQTRTVSTYPSVSLPSCSGGLPVEVCLIAQLGPGAGDQLIAGVEQRQRAHPAFLDALDEPSTRIGRMDLERGDSTSLYSFTVGPAGHPFHRHAGHRVFTAVSGSAGAQLRFSTASAQQLAQDEGHFVRALRFVDIPADSLFTVRFGGGTWHQFVPLCERDAAHPALFALSCHTDELGGDLSPELRQRVMANEADIALLTEVLSPSLRERLAGLRFDEAVIPTWRLSLNGAKNPFMAGLRAWARRMAGRLRGAWGRRPVSGSVSEAEAEAETAAAARPFLPGAP